jgi:Asp-tRNA(Asn)/Glu-tRNA(Gln) amidotransferase A subunit family amidase
MPTSLQIACRGYHEATALRIGWAFEQAFRRDASPAGL